MDNDEVIPSMDELTIVGRETCITMLLVSDNHGLNPLCVDETGFVRVAMIVVVA